MGLLPRLASSVKKSLARSCTRASSSSRRSAISLTSPRILIMSLSTKCVSTINVFFRTLATGSRSGRYTCAVYGSTELGKLAARRR
jgi:hypothetical protein